MNPSDLMERREHGSPSSDDAVPAERLNEVAILLSVAMLRLRRKERAVPTDNSLEVPARLRLLVAVGGHGESECN